VKYILDPSDHQYYREDGIKVPGVSEILKKSGIVDMSYMQENAPQLLEASQKKGTDIHRMLELYDKGIEDEESRKLEFEYGSYLDVWKDFLEQEKGAIQTRFIEYTFGNETLGFAGTLDRVIVINGHWAILDIKTGSKQKHHALQLAAYKFLLDHDRSDGAFGFVYKRYSVYLKEDGYKLAKYESNLDEPAFIGALNIVKWKETRQMTAVK